MEIITDGHSSWSNTAGETQTVDISLSHMVLQSAITTAGLVVGTLLIDAARYKLFRDKDTLEISDSKHVKVTCRIDPEEVEDFVEEVKMKAEDYKKAKER